MIKSKDRKTKLSSKRKVRMLMELFEKKIDAEIELINIDTNCIQTTDGEFYHVDFKTNSVVKYDWQRYKLISWGDD